MDDKYSAPKPTEEGSMSRRAFLKGSAATSIAINLRHSWLGSSIHLISGPGWVAVCRDKREIFHLSSNSFHGKPKVWTERVGDTVAFGLDGARFPGTDTCADLVCELWQGALGVHTSLNYDALGLSFRGSAHEWLGEEGLWARLRKPITFVDCPDFRLIVDGGDARLCPDGTLQLHGKTTAHLSSGLAHLPSNRVELAVMSLGDTPELSVRRSRIVLHRGHSDWDISAPRGCWEYSEEKTLFDRAEITAHENETGDTHYLATLSRSSPRSNFVVMLDEPLTDSRGISPVWRMRNPEYSLELGKQGSGRFTAELANTVLVQVGHLRLGLRNPADGPALVSEHGPLGNGTSQIQAQAAISGEINEAIILHEDSNWHVRIDRDKKQRDFYKQSTLEMIGKTISLQGLIQFRLIRPTDAVDLYLHITNVVLQPRTFGSSDLEFIPASDPSGISLLIADLPPQTLAEPVEPSSSPKETDLCGNTSPTRSRIAAASRVSMRLFDKHGGAASLSLETLLQWWRYPLNIVSQAQTKPTGSPLQLPSDIPSTATEIVAPAGLSFSPIETQVFVATEKVRKDKEVTQVWLARLATRLDPIPKQGAGSDFSQFPVTDDTRPSIRPILPRPLLGNAGTGGAPGIYGISNTDAVNIVRDMQDKVADARHLFVSSTGAWLDVKAKYPPDRASISGFDIKIANGEEMLEEVFMEAILIPTGHRVTVIKTSKRQWCRPKGIPFLVSRIVQRFKIVYHDPTIDYGYLRTGDLPEGALQLPFESVTLCGKETPFLEWIPASDFWMGCESQAQFIPACGTSPGVIASPAYWAYVQDTSGHEVSVVITNPGSGYTSTPNATFSSPGAGVTLNGTAVVTNGSVSSVTITNSSGDYRTTPTVAFDPPPAPGIRATGIVTLGVPYRFPVQCVDRAGIAHQTTMAMAVACFSQSYDADYASQLTAEYNNPTGVNTAVDFNKARVAYAKQIRHGDTAHPTGRMFLCAKLAPDLCSAQKSNQPPWYPSMQQAELSLDHLSAFGNGSSTTVPKYSYAKQYQRYPFDYTLPPSRDLSANRAEVLLAPTITDPQSPTGFSADKPIPLNFAGHLGGGIALPDAGVQAVSRARGAIFHDLASAQNAVYDAENFLTTVGNDTSNISDVFAIGGTAATLLGAVGLGDLLAQVSQNLSKAAQLPLLAAQQLQTLEEDAIDALKTALQPVVNLQTQIHDDIASLVANAKTAEDALQKAVNLVASFIRVTLLEQTAGDVNALTKAPAPINSMAAALQKEIAKATSIRIQDATTIPHYGSNVQLPTLYGFRDYAANQLMAGAGPNIAAINATVAKVDNYLSTRAQTITNDLNNTSTCAGQAFSILGDNFLFSLSSDLDDLAEALTNSDIDELATSIENVVSDVQSAAQSIKDFPVAMSRLQKCISDLITQLPAELASEIDLFITEIQADLQGQLQTDITNALGTIKNSPQFQATTNAISSAVNAATAVISSVTTELASNSTQIQNLLDIVNNARDLLNLPKQISVNYDYDTPLNDFSLFIAQNNGHSSEFSIHSSVIVNLDGTPPTFSLTASVTNFRLLLIPSAPFISLGFKEATFQSINGSSPKVTCPFDPSEIQFLGPLNFVAGLVSSINLGDVLTAQINDLGVTIGTNLALPEIESGLFDLVNLSLYTGVHLDFTGAPLQVTFGFASPEQHFTATYDFLGGGGFVDLTFTPFGDTQGMEVSAAIELGAMVALDFGVASGEAHVFAGFYMRLADHDFQLSGYYRSGGELDVLGLISASVEFTLALSYEDRGGQAWLSGECDIVIDVSVLFFSTSVSLDMHHDFAGSSAS
jgi:hypothetical protein